MTGTVPIQRNFASEPIPGRKTLRAWLAPVMQYELGVPLFWVAADWACLALLITGTVGVDSWVAKLALGFLAGLWIGRLFILGHDACHQSLTRYRGLNRVLGRLTFLASLTPYSLWEVGHNVVHHGFTNLKGHDFVWAPLSVEEYRALSPSRQLLERMYRSGYFPWLYYLVEVWWLRMFFPSRRHMATRRPIFLADSLLVSMFGAAWIAALAVAGHLTGQSWLWTVGFGFVVPFIVWNGMIGAVIYLHHTHTEVTWYDDKSAWLRSSPFVTGTVHLAIAPWADRFMHFIMQHTAHHVDMTIPFYRLRDAQSILEQHLGSRIVRQPFCWNGYVDTAHRCKLYDFAQKRWLDFNGHPTSEPVAPA